MPPRVIAKPGEFLNRKAQVKKRKEERQGKKEKKILKEVDEEG